MGVKDRNGQIWGSLVAERTEGSLIEYDIDEDGVIDFVDGSL